MAGFIIFIIVIVLAVLLLRGFDRVAGRGPQQVRDGINQSSIASTQSVQRVACPYCAEMIMPSAKLCPFCKSSLTKDHDPAA